MMSDSKFHLLAFIFLLCIFKNLSCDINLTFGQTDKVKLWAVTVCLLFKITLSSPPFYFFWFLHTGIKFLFLFREPGFYLTCFTLFRLSMDVKSLKRLLSEWMLSDFKRTRFNTIARKRKLISGSIADLLKLWTHYKRKENWKAQVKHTGPKLCWHHIQISINVAAC